MTLQTDDAMCAWGVICRVAFVWKRDPVYSSLHTWLNGGVLLYEFSVQLLVDQVVPVATVNLGARQAGATWPQC